MWPQHARTQYTQGGQGEGMGESKRTTRERGQTCAFFCNARLVYGSKLLGQFRSLEILEALEFPCLLLTQRLLPAIHRITRKLCRLSLPIASAGVCQQSADRHGYDLVLKISSG